jgi:hypothetical protein
MGRIIVATHKFTKCPPGFASIAGRAEEGEERIDEADIPDWIRRCWHPTQYLLPGGSLTLRAVPANAAGTPKDLPTLTVEDGAEEQFAGNVIRDYPRELQASDRGVRQQLFYPGETE